MFRTFLGYSRQLTLQGSHMRNCLSTASASVLSPIQLDFNYFESRNSFNYFHRAITLEPSSKDDFLELLSTATSLAVDVNLQGIVIAPPPVSDKLYFEFKVLPNVLFKRNFYDDLFNEIRSNYNVALIGSAGVSTSAFQFYMLKRYVDYFDNPGKR